MYLYQEGHVQGVMYILVNGYINRESQSPIFLSSGLKCSGVHKTDTVIELHVPHNITC